MRALAVVWLLAGLLYGPAFSTAQLTLELDASFSPPTVIPTDPMEMTYNAPALDYMLEPVKVNILDGGVPIFEPVLVTATTILSANENDPGNPGDPYPGTLCQHNKWSHRYAVCRYMFDDCIEMVCNTSDASFPLGKVEVLSENGVAEFHRLLHTLPTEAMGDRRLRFFASVNGTDVVVTSNSFTVHYAAAKLEIVSAPAGSVDVNAPMSFQVQTKAVTPADPNTFFDLTTGRHSALNVDMTIAWDFKRFYIYFPNSNYNFYQLYSSQYNLEGEDVIETGKFDRIIRKQCVAGAATFDNFVITSVAENIQLNFTQTLPYYPWERVPPVYEDPVPLDWVTWTLSTDVANTTSPAVAFSNPFNVEAQAVDSFRIEPDSLTQFNLVPEHNANFELNSPLKVQVLDASGNLVTDGPDSMLTVTVEVLPADTCLSNDSSFTLTNGEAVFPGSICAPAASVSLRFTITSSAGPDYSTDWTPNFAVSGEILIAAIFPIYSDVNYGLHSAAAVNIINKGVWDQDFVDAGRFMSFQNYYVDSPDIQETLRVYDLIREQNTDPTRPHIRAIVGSTSEEDTLALSRISKRHGMPVMGYIAESGELSDKSAHPYFNRVSYAEYARYYAEGAYLASFHWNRVIVIKDANHPIPVDMYRGFEQHGVKIVLELTVPAISADDPEESWEPLDELADQIELAGTRVIYHYTWAPADVYLYREAMRLGFAPIDGYLWIGNSVIMRGFPYINNRGGCDTVYPPCSTAFNSSLSVIPGPSVDIEAGYWKDYLFDGYTHLDTVKTVGITLWRWPSVLGEHSVSHDAVIAIFKGAVEIIHAENTISGASLSEAIRTVSFEGATGFIKFDENGDRPGYVASVYNWNPVTDTPLVSNDVLWVAATWFVDPVTLETVETQLNSRLLAGNVEIPGFVSLPPIEYFNTRSTVGYLPGSDELQVIEYPVPAAYWCSGGCGGGLSPMANGTIYYYNYGTCVGQEDCQCRNKDNSSEPGYAGSSCQQVLCEPQCRNGECVEPDVCSCEPYWTGVDCGTPMCTVSGCNAEFGTCTGPNICTCVDRHWGSDCTQHCSCQYGVCNEGQNGNGECSVCDSGYMGANCDLSIPLVVIPTVLAVFALVTAIVIFAVWYLRRMKFRAALANNDWIVDYNDLTILSEAMGAASSMAFRSMVSLAADTQREKNVVRNQGKWNGVEVVIKMLDKDSVPITTQQRLEVKAMRDLRHNNLAAFIGACCESPNVCVLMEGAPKGSLDDILSTNSIQLDWNFKYSLLKDICRGMVYLSTTPIKSHGRLKSSNCVVDNRWTLKITDYGMHMFKSDQHGVAKFNPALGMTAEDMEEGIENSVKAALLYTAPELLRTGIIHPDHVGAGSIQADMYSLAIIMVEILTHDAPYHEYLDYVEVQDILDAVVGRKTITSQLPQAWPKTGSVKELRPTIPDDTDPPFAQLVESIWVEDPSERPTFPQVLKQLNSISPQRSDLMDNLVNMLEKYSTNLEGIVAERTQELAAEKAKTDELVCRMLPKQIADQLKTGQPVSAETFECVTIYFSDIVGFTKIAGDSTPMQVVDLLNDLYTCFDAIIDHFDVYKVETIGDAYMVVSGLPQRNGDQHAGEIASMSLHLLSAILTFKIRHMPDRKLQLRIGMHSGPCVAGVVGLKMPRYCLFGDTVNTASRMESGGMALKIHMSDSSADILEKLGGYHLESRGEREVKGKGVMTTYWLKTKDGYNRPLPTDDMAVSASQHEFK